MVVIMAGLLIQRALFVHGLVAQSHELPRRLANCCAVWSSPGSANEPRGAAQSAVGEPLGLWSVATRDPHSSGDAHPVAGHELKSVLLHELAHVKRSDLWLNLVQALLQVVYFFHPLLWAANARIRKLREQAVDETVLAALGEEAEDYPRTLLSVSRLAFGQPMLSLRLLGVVESQKTLRDRIRHMVSRPFPQTARLGFTGCALVMVLAVTLLPMASAAPQSAKIEGTAAADALPGAGAGTVADHITLTGQVTDPQGKLVEGAEVTFYLETAGEIGSCRSSRRSTAR